MFKKDDMVICIDAGYSDLVIYQTYTVSSYEYLGMWVVTLREFPDYIFYPERFEILKGKKP